MEPQTTKRDWIATAIGLAIIFGLIWLISNIRCIPHNHSGNGVTTVCDTITVRDTVFVNCPILVRDTVIDSITHILPKTVRDTILMRDSAEVLIPISQREYKDTLYNAWVSGYEPHLDSIRIYQQREIIKITERPKPHRWHIGPTIGYGMTPAGFKPYVGISLTYSILSWK